MPFGKAYFSSYQLTGTLSNSRRHQSLVAKFGNPPARPLNGFEVQIAYAAGQEDHAIDAAFLQPAQAEFTLMLHHIEGHWLTGAVVIKIAAQRFAAIADEGFEAL